MLLVTCLPDMHEALSAVPSIPSTSVVAYVCDPSNGEVEVGASTRQVWGSLGCMSSCLRVKTSHVSSSTHVVFSQYSSALIISALPNVYSYLYLVTTVTFFDIFSQPFSKPKYVLWHSPQAGITSGTLCCVFLYVRPVCLGKSLDTFVCFFSFLLSCFPRPNW